MSIIKITPQYNIDILVCQNSATVKVYTSYGQKYMDIRLSHPYVVLPKKIFGCVCTKEL